MTSPGAVTVELVSWLVAARKFFRKLLKGLRYVPRVLVTDKLAATCPPRAPALLIYGSVTWADGYSVTRRRGW